jgi:hypothetical protein
VRQTLVADIHGFFVLLALPSQHEFGFGENCDSAGPIYSDPPVGGLPFRGWGGVGGTEGPARIYLPTQVRVK